MFNAIARSYERVNSLFSFGRDAAWRRDTVRLAGVTPEDVVLDVACGTGDMARAARSGGETTRGGKRGGGRREGEHRRGKQHGGEQHGGARLVVGCDFAHEMLRLAAERERAEAEAGTTPEAAMSRAAGAQAPTVAPGSAPPVSSRRDDIPHVPRSDHLPGAPLSSRRDDIPHAPGSGQRSGAALRDVTPIQFCEADGLKLPFRDGAFSAVFCAFGVRNFQDMDQGLREFHRVLRPGGRAAILEFSRPRNPLVRAVSEAYSGHIMPRLATLLSRDRSGAYHYLPRSVTSFADAAELTARLHAAGFARVEATTRTFGVVTIYLAWR